MVRDLVGAAVLVAVVLDALQVAGAVVEGLVRAAVEQVVLLAVGSLHQRRPPGRQAAPRAALPGAPGGDEREEGRQRADGPIHGGEGTISAPQPKRPVHAIAQRLRQNRNARIHFGRSGGKHEGLSARDRPGGGYGTRRDRSPEARSPGSGGQAHACVDGDEGGAGAVAGRPPGPAGGPLLPELRDHRDPAGFGARVVRGAHLVRPQPAPRPGRRPARGGLHARQQPCGARRGLHAPRPPGLRRPRRGRSGGHPQRPLVPHRPALPAGRRAAHQGQDQRPGEGRGGGPRRRFLQGSAAGPRAGSGRAEAGPQGLGGQAAEVHAALRAPRRHLRRRRQPPGLGGDALVHEQRGLGPADRADLLPAVDPRHHQGGRRDGAAPLRDLRRLHPGGAAGRRHRAQDGRPDHPGPAGAAPRAAGRSLHGPRHPLRPGRQRLLPRDLRPPGRGPPAEGCRRQPDLQEEAQPTRPARELLHPLRPDPHPDGRPGPGRPLRLRQPGREGPARDRGGERRLQVVPDVALSHRGLPRLQRARAQAGRLQPGLPPVEPAGGGGPAAEPRGPEAAAARRDQDRRQAVRAALRRHPGRVHVHRAHHAQRVQRAAGDGVPHLPRRPRGAGAGRGPHRHPSHRLQPDRGGRRRDRGVQRRLRGRVRRRAGLGGRPRGAGGPDRGAEEDAVAGSPAAPARSSRAGPGRSPHEGAAGRAGAQRGEAARREARPPLLHRLHRHRVRDGRRRGRLRRPDLQRREPQPRPGGRGAGGGPLPGQHGLRGAAGRGRVPHSREAPACPSTTTTARSAGRSGWPRTASTRRRWRTCPANAPTCRPRAAATIHPTSARRSPPR